MRSRLLVARLAAMVLAAGLISLAGAPPAAAQGFYYKEIRKDDRIYVFNNAEEAARFEKSGEMGRAITRPGAGPNGETVVADSERALELFFFKHGISEPVPQPPPPPPPAPSWRISGLVFGDYYYFAQSHDPKWEGQQGFWLRRAYFTYDQNLGTKITTRLRLELNSNGKLTGGALTPYVKDAYMRWTYYGRQQLTLGIQPSATFDWIEGFWGLRHIEKTPADLYRIDSSRDFAIGFSGPINDAQTVRYVAQVGNDSGSNAETNANKAVRLELRYETNPGFAVEGFYGYLSQPGGADRHIGQGFAGYRTKNARAAFQYVFQRRQPLDGSGRPNVDITVLSGFGVFDVVPKKAGLYVRVDRSNDPNPDAAGIDYLPIDPRAKFTFALVGLEYYLHPSVRVSPNVEWVTYSTLANGTKIEADIVPRITFYWTW